MEPAGAVLREDPIPIDLAGFYLRNCGVPAIGATQCASYPESSFRKIKAIPNRPADAVIRQPSYILLSHSALQHQVFDQASDGVFGKRGNDGCVQSKATPQSARHVIFAS